jgi:hypothetical protein
LAIEHAATVQQGETGDCQWNDSYSRCESHLTWLATLSSL